MSDEEDISSGASGRPSKAGRESSLSNSSFSEWLFEATKKEQNLNFILST